MNTTPAVFQFHTHEVRIISKDGQPWFVAVDVCKALGYQNSRKAVADHLDNDEKGVTTGYTPSGDQSLTIISESGLYALVLRSRKPEARKFAKWVTSEVLPAIRKTGSYAAPSEPLTPTFPVEAIRQHLQSARYIMHFTRDGAMVLKEIPEGARLLRDEDIANVVGDPSCMLDRNLLGGIIRAALNRLAPQR